MKRRQKQALTWIGSLILLAMAAGCASNAKKPETLSSEQTVPLVGDFKVNRYSLKNGLRLLVVEDHSSPTFAYQTWFRVGSKDEVPGYTGLAHLFEHMMFKETKNLKDGEFDRILEAAGAEGENAFTSRDYTAYVQEMPANRLDLIAKLESDRMVNLIVDDKAFSTEREVVQNERRFRMENSPDGLMYQEIFGIAFTKHPYHWPVIGYQEDLARMTAKEARAFYHDYYSPNHATIVVVGDVKPSEVLATVEKYYGAIPSAESPAHSSPVEPVATAPRTKTLKLNMQVDKLLMGYPIPEFVSPDSAAIEVMQSVLTGGKSSRLHRALVETGIATGVDSFDLDDEDPSLFLIAANLQKGKRATQAQSVILKEIDRLSKNPPSEQEVTRAKNRLSFNFFEALNSNSEKARFLGHYETIANSFEKGIEVQKQISNVTPVQVQEVAKRYLNPKSRSVITGVPK